MIATTFDRAVSYLYYADRVYQLPLGVVGVAIGVVLLARHVAQARAAMPTGAALASQNRALELALFLTLPATVALIAHRPADRQGLFRAWRLHRVRYDRHARGPRRLRPRPSRLRAEQVFSPGFFAREDTATPMIFAILSVVVNFCAALVLSRWWGHVGIAFATAIAAWVNASLSG